MEKKISSITITRHDFLIRTINDEEPEVRESLSQFTEFDPDGRVRKDCKYNESGEFEEMVEYSYDNHGRLLSESFSIEEGEISETITYLSDPDTGRVISASKSYQDGSADTITYTYDQAGLLVEKVTENDEGEVEQTDKYIYEDGILVRHETYDHDNELFAVPYENTHKQSDSRVERNEAGQVILEEDYDSEGNLMMSVKRSYTGEGQPDEVEVFIDGRGRAISRHYILKYAYTYFD